MGLSRKSLVAAGLAFLAVFSWILFKPQAHVQWLQYSKVGEERMIETHKPYILFFTGNSCLTCHAQEKMWDNATIEKHLRDKGITPIRSIIDDKINKSQELQAMKDHQALFTPAYVLVDKNGKVYFSDSIYSTQAMIDFLDQAAV